MANGSSRNRYMAAAICGGLLVAVLLVFGQTVRFGFVNYDDDKYVSGNVQVTTGLTGSGVVWAFTNNRAQMWIPMTWLSLMCDAQLFGSHAWGYHLTNVLLHAAAVIGLFLVLWQMTGRLWPSALAAALFAVHPLRAESVAWVTERKDVLSGLFFVLTLHAYLRYVRRPFSISRYLAVVVLAALGLMSKPILVTLPFVLLLLDYWPLERMAVRPKEDEGNREDRRRALGVLARLVLEKVPLFAIVAADCAITYALQDKSLSHNAEYPISWRIGNALISYVTYLREILWPVGLAASYPRLPLDLPWRQVGVSVLVLLAITAAAVACRRRRPYLLVGWLWYLAMLVPVIGLLQIGTTSVADRFTYLPQIGLGIAAAWWAADLCGSSVVRRRAIGVAATTVVLCLTAFAWRQTAYWRDSETLWRQSLANNPEDAFALGSLGMALQEGGRIDQAIEHYEAALKIRPDDAVHNNLGVILASRGDLDAAMTHFQQAIAISPDYAGAQINVGSVFVERGQFEKAASHFKKATEAAPDDAQARVWLGNALHRQGKDAEAAAEWRTAVQLQPENVRLLNQLAWLLATCPDASVRSGGEAVTLAEWAAQRTGGKDPVVLGTLAAAYAEAGEYSKAIGAAQAAVAMALARGDVPTTNAVRNQLKLYRAGVPYHETRVRRGK